MMHLIFWLEVAPREMITRLTDTIRYSDEEWIDDPTKNPLKHISWHTDGNL